MTALEQATAICEQVDKICENGVKSPEEYSKILDKLAKIPMTVDIIKVIYPFNQQNVKIYLLQITNIGIKVNTMRKKVPDEAMAKRAKNIIKVND